MEELVFLFVLKNKRTGKLVTGTNFNCHPHRQVMNPYSPPLLISNLNLEFEIKKRGISLKTYETVRVAIVEIQVVRGMLVAGKRIMQNVLSHYAQPPEEK